MQDLELLDGLGVLAGLGQLIGEHQPDVILTGAQVREFLQRLEGVGVLAGPVHPVGVLEEVLFGVAVEALFRRDLTELVVDLVPLWGVAQDLVAERYGVVQVAAVGVEIDRLLVIVDGLVGLVEAQIEVAYAVINRDVAVLIVSTLLDYLEVDLQSAIELLFLLEFGSLFFQLVNCGHSGAARKMTTRQAQPP